MKKRINILALSILAIGSCVAATTSTVAWFKFGNDIGFGGGQDVPLQAGAEISYYGGGDGSLESPYIISERIHLYNLAWLQYIGTYNKDSIQQLYFKVTADIDMAGVTIPPIGTDQYPFLSNFDGNGKTISNVTISNDDPTKDDSAFGVMKPGDDILAGTIPPEVVGFFGVVGKLPSQPISYDSSIVGMNNFTLNTIAVNSKTSKTLMGLAAGYVDGAMSGVKISGKATLNVDGESTTASLGSITNKISDYGLVGYTTHTSRTGTFSQDLSSYYDSDDDSGGGDNWGGSIAVEEIFNRLYTIKDNYTVSTNSFATEVTSTYKSDGTTFVGSTTTDTTDEIIYEYNENQNRGSYNNKIGAFQFGDDRDDIHYLSGGHFTRKNYQYAHNGYQITDGTNYLTYNGSVLGNTTNSSDTTVISTWHFVLKSDSDYYIRLNYNDNNDNRYLYNNNGVLAIGNGTSTASNATWTIVQDSNGMQITNGSYQIYYTYMWLLVPTNDTTVYYIKSGNNYISSASANNAAVSTTTTKSDAAQFYVDSDNHFYFLGGSNGTTKMYLAFYYTYGQGGIIGRVNSHTYEVRASSSLSTSNLYYFTYVGGVLSASVRVASGGTWLTNPTFTATTTYLRYNNGWTYTQTSSERLNPTSETIYFSNYRILDTLSQPIVNADGPDTHTDNTSANNFMDYSGQDVTYFPLNTKSDFTPSDNNTGYIIGGSSYSSNNTDYGYGTVRISNIYNLTDSIGNYSTSTHKLTNVRSYNASGPITINDNSNAYQRYADSKVKVENILKNDEAGKKVYGLHFMQNLISKNNLVTARYAQINTTAYSNYQLPASSIDFNLKERGFVNFFAGTYGQLSSDGNTTTRIDSFFSLHQIRRDTNNNIVSIDEIAQILSDGNQDHAYIYKLTNGKYTIPYSYDIYNQKTKYVVDTTIPLGNQYPDEEFTQVDTCPGTYSVVFDTSWIKVHSDYVQHVMYYYEIPINCGEFCLGSVDGSHFGAYLVYLDIGAFARDNDKVEAYYVTTHVNSSAYPDGIDFAVADAAGTGGESFGIYLPSNISGSISFNISTDNVAVSDSSSISTYSFKGNKYSETVSSGKFTISGDSPGALEVPPAGGERLIHITVDAVDGFIWYIDILDQLDANGNILNTSYPLIKKNGVDQDPSAIPDSVTSVLDDEIRTLTRIVTFTRNSGIEDFNTTATYDAATRKIVSATVTSDNLSSISIGVSNLVSGYTVSINGVAVSNGSTYHP